jgi:hypothetical protein
MSAFVGTFQQFIATVAPWFLRNKNVGRFLEAFALTLDSAGDSLAQGLHLSQPLRCDSSALPILAGDRTLDIYPTEPDSSKRYRLSQWWQLHRQFGTHQGELRNAQPLFLPDPLPIMRIVHQDGTGRRATWHTLAGDGTYSIYKKSSPSNWNWDGQTSEWSRYWVIIYTNGLTETAPDVYDAGNTWDDGTLWDGDPSADQIADLVAALGADSKSAHSKLWGVILTSDPASFSPTATATTDAEGWTSLPVGNWGYVIDNTTGQPTRPPYASFIYDLGEG